MTAKAFCDTLNSRLFCNLQRVLERNFLELFASFRLIKASKLPDLDSVAPDHPSVLRVHVCVS